MCLEQVTSKWKLLNLREEKNLCHIESSPKTTFDFISILDRVRSTTDNRVERSVSRWASTGARANDFQFSICTKKKHTEQQQQHEMKSITQHVYKVEETSRVRRRNHDNRTSSNNWNWLISIVSIIVRQILKRAGAPRLMLITFFSSSLRLPHLIQHSRPVECIYLLHLSSLAAAEHFGVVVFFTVNSPHFSRLSRLPSSLSNPSIWICIVVVVVELTELRCLSL